jgi:Uma2 family endonuclease
MASATLISVGEYLATTYRPDCEMIDGELIERNFGEYEHANLQGALTGWFYSRQREWNIRVLPQQRIKVSASRYRIPDVCILTRDQPIEPVFTHPPLICIEVLSKDDSLRSMQDRIDDYLSFGVANVWILDPAMRRAYVCDRTGLHEPENNRLEAAGTPIVLSLAELFSQLD